MGSLESRAVFLQRVRGRFREMKLAGTLFESKVLRGFRFDVRWLWAKRRPSAYRIVRDLLGESS